MTKLKTRLKAYCGRLPMVVPDVITEKIYTWGEPRFGKTHRLKIRADESLKMTASSDLVGYRIRRITGDWYIMLYTDPEQHVLAPSERVGPLSFTEAELYAIGTGLKDLDK